MGVILKRPVDHGISLSNVARRPLLANYFRIDPKTNIKLYRYKIIFDPDPKNALATKYAIKRLMETPQFQSQKIATDYATILVTKEPLTNGEQEALSGELPPEHPEAFVRQTAINWTISHVFTHDIDSILKNKLPKESLLQALNLAVSRKPAANFDSIVNIRGNRFFDLATKEQTALDMMSTVYRGYFSSVRHSARGLLLNVNAVAAAFVTPRSVRALEDMLCGEVQVLADHVRGLRVQYLHPPERDGEGPNEAPGSRRLMKKVVRSLARFPTLPPLSARTATFDWTVNGQTRETTVENYYFESKFIQASRYFANV